MRLVSRSKNPIYSCVFNTSHTVLGDMPNFYEKPVCITRHAIPFYERPGCNTGHTNSLLMWQWHHYCFEVTREGLRPGCNCRHGKLFTQRPSWNKRILRKIQCVLIKSPVTCIQDQRVCSYLLVIWWKRRIQCLFNLCYLRFPAPNAVKIFGLIKANFEANSANFL